MSSSTNIILHIFQKMRIHKRDSTCVCASVNNIIPISLIFCPCIIFHLCNHHYQLFPILFIVFNDDFIIEIMIVLYKDNICNI